MDDEKRLLTSIKSMEKAAAIKEAKLRVSDVEDDIGTYLSDKDETKVRRLIKEREGKSFALRHPLLTGIPTLGIAPAVAKSNAKEIIIRRMARDDAKLRDKMEKLKRQRRADALEEFRLDTERDKANQASRAAGALGKSGVEIAALMAASKMKKEGSATTVSALRHASGALYTDVYKTRGLQKHAFRNIFPALTQGAGGWAAGAGLAGGIAGGARRLQQLRALGAEGAAGKAARKAWGKDWSAAMAEKSVARKAGKEYVLPGRLKQEQEFLKGLKGLRGKTLKDNPMDFLKVYGPEVARAALESGGAAALAGGGGRIAANALKRKKFIDTAKSVAVPAALGLGGYALLKD